MSESSDDSDFSDGDSDTVRGSRSLGPCACAHTIDRGYWLQEFLLLLISSQRSLVKRKRGGSVPGRAANLNRDFAAGHARLWNDYFSAAPVYPEGIFRRRFRMSRALHAPDGRCRCSRCGF